MDDIVSYLTRIGAVVVGLLWAYIEPNIPFLMLALFAMLLDCYSAFRLNRRIKKYYPKASADGKLKSSHLSKMVSDMVIIFAAIIMAHLIERYCFPHLMPIYLPNYVCAVFCAVQIVSILENESSCNGKPWARLAQKIVANKISRHLLDGDDLDQMMKETKAEMAHEAAKIKKAGTNPEAPAPKRPRRRKNPAPVIPPMG